MIIKTQSLGVVFIDGSFDPLLKISVGGKIYEFEMHPYCGPTLLSKKGDPIDVAKHPKDFLHASSLWAQQGKRMEDGFCRWDHEPKKIVKHLGGKYYKIVGYEKSVRGE